MIKPKLIENLFNTHKSQGCPVVPVAYLLGP